MPARIIKMARQYRPRYLNPSFELLILENKPVELPSLGKEPATAKAPPNKARDLAVFVNTPPCGLAATSGRCRSKAHTKIIVPDRIAAHRAFFPVVMAAPAAIRITPGK